MAFFVVLVSLVVTWTHVSMAELKHINLDNYEVGDCIEVQFTAPTSRAAIDLLENDGAKQLHLDYQVNYGLLQNTVLLHTNLQLGDNWQPTQEQLVSSAATSPGDSVEFSICADGDYQTFIVSFNGKLMTSYTNNQINISRVKRVQFDDYGGDAKLQRMNVVYAEVPDMQPN